MIAECYLKKEGDRSNYVYFDDRNLVVRYKDAIHRISLKSATRITIHHKKYILPILLGGIAGSFSLLMIWHNLFSPWPILVAFLASLAAFYFGWQGSWMFIVQQSSQELTFPVTEQHAHLKRFAAFFNQFQKGEHLKKIYHITTKQLWIDQKDSASHRDPSLEKEGFIHASEVHQISDVFNRFFVGQQNLVLLEIDALKLINPLKYETAEDVNERFPHIYGPINNDAIIRAIALQSSDRFDPGILN